jgi:hypothetical protein
MLADTRALPGESKEEHRERTQKGGQGERRAPQGASPRRARRPPSPTDARGSSERRARPGKRPDDPGRGQGGEGRRVVSRPGSFGGWLKASRRRAPRRGSRGCLGAAQKPSQKVGRAQAVVGCADAGVAVPDDPAVPGAVDGDRPLPDLGEPGGVEVTAAVADELVAGRQSGSWLPG